MPEISESDFRCVLVAYGGKNCMALLKDPKSYKATFDIISAIAKKDPIGLASASSSGASTYAKHSALSSSTKQAARSASMGLSTFKTSMNLAKVANLTPTRAIALIGASVVTKTGLALSLAGGDSEKAKCIGAVTELAGSAAGTAAVTTTIPTGVGAALFVLSAASLAASAWSAYDACEGIIFSGGATSSNSPVNTNPAPTSSGASSGPVQRML